MNEERDRIGEGHSLFPLVYRPSVETLFLQTEQKCCQLKNSTC